MTAHRNLTGLLRSTTFSHVYGEKLPIGVRPNLSARQFIQRYNVGWFSSLSNEDFDWHFQGQETFYFFGTPYVKDEFTLVMGDIDVPPTTDAIAAGGSRTEEGKALLGGC